MSTALHHPHLGIFILAWFVADLLIPLLILASHRFRILDRPGGHKNQSHPVPFLGGVGIFFAFTIAVGSTLRFNSLESFLPFLAVLGGGAVVVVLGLVDDFRPISALVKLFALFGITLLLWTSGIHLEILPGVLYSIPNLLLTLIWIVGVTSATNSLDNTDGIVGGVTAIASVFLFSIAWGTSTTDAQPWLSYFAVAMAGSCIGFLRYNFAPARIYLGDNGAFFIGFMLSTMMVFAHYSTDPLQAMLIPCLVLSVPIFDIVLATWLRIRDGDVRGIRAAVVYCGRDHMAHLLMALGLSKRQTACAIYLLAVLGGGIALLVLAAESPAAYLTIAGLYLGFLALVGVVLGQIRRQLRFGAQGAGGAALFARAAPPLPLEAVPGAAGVAPAVVSTSELVARAGGPAPASAPPARRRRTIDPTSN